MNFVYFASVGDLDFNYAEMLQLTIKLDELGVPNRVRVFEGPHKWPPAEGWMEGVECLELMAMRRGLRDAAFLRSNAALAPLREDSG